MKKVSLIMICLTVVLTLLSGCKQDIQAQNIDKSNNYESTNKDTSHVVESFNSIQNNIELNPSENKYNDYEGTNSDESSDEKNPNGNKAGDGKKLDDAQVSNEQKLVGNKNNDYNECIYYNKKDFYSTMNLEVDETYKDVSGLVCTHHLLASELLHEGFLKIEDRDNYDKVLILGPDHNTTDSKNIYTSSNDWTTPFGILEIEDKSLETLLTYPKIVVNNELMEKEHSNSALIPFIKYYFKEAKVINAAIPGTIDLGEILDFSSFLEENIIDDKTLFIASIDFSHYLDYERANSKDKETIGEIKKNNYLNIHNFTNDNLDSPQSMITFLDIMNKKNKELNIVNNKNSFDIISIDDKNTTSYFTLIYN